MGFLGRLTCLGEAVDDAELTVKMLNSGAPGVMIDLEDSMANFWENSRRGYENALAAIQGTLAYFDKKRNQQVGISAGPPSLRVSGNFVYLPAQVQNEVVTIPSSGQNVVYGKREQLSFSVTAKLTRYWSMQASETISLTNSTALVNNVPSPMASSASLYGSLSAIYQDECMAFIGALTQSGIRSGDVVPGYSVVFSVVFKNLGEIGGTVASLSGGAL